MTYLMNESNFKGAFCGILLAEFLNNNQSENINNYESEIPLKIAISLGQSIIKYQQFDPNLWLNDLEKKKKEFLKYQNTFNDIEIMIISLPISLFYFDNVDQLEGNLQSIINIWRSPNVSTESVFIWSLIIKILLDNDLNSTNFMNKLEGVITQQNLLFPEIFITINHFIETKTPLHQIKEQLHNCKEDKSLVIIAQVLYCFFTMKDDFELCLLRTKSTTYYPNLTTSLTAVLLGLSQGYDHFPLKWRLLISSSVLHQEIMTLSSNLVKLWSGFLSI